MRTPTFSAAQRKQCAGIPRGDIVSGCCEFKGIWFPGIVSCLRWWSDSGAVVWDSRQKVQEMKWIIAIAALVLSSACLACAQDVTGDWQGTLNAGTTQLHVVLHITQDN